MASKEELLVRAGRLAEKYDEETLKNALCRALGAGDNEERLVLQNALKQKTGAEWGYDFTLEAMEKNKTRLSI